MGRKMARTTKGWAILGIVVAAGLLSACTDSGVKSPGIEAGTLHDAAQDAVQNVPIDGAASIPDAASDAVSAGGSDVRPDASVPLDSSPDAPVMPDGSRDMQPDRSAPLDASPDVPLTTDSGDPACQAAGTCADAGADAVLPGGGGLDGGGSLIDGLDGEAGIRTYVASAAMKKLVQGLADLAAGVPADLNGTGTPATTLAVNPDGSFTLTYAPATGTPVVVQSNGTGTVTITDSSGPGGVPHQTDVFTSSATIDQETLTVDEDFNGMMDHRYTWITRASSPDVQSYTEEDDTAETGNWTTVQSLTLTTWKNQGTPCNGGDRFPTTGTSFQPPDWGGRLPIHIMLGSGAPPGGVDLTGECDPDTTASIMDAVDCAMTDGKACIDATNGRESGLLDEALLPPGQRTRAPLDIGCGGGCTNLPAATAGRAASGGRDSQMNINPSIWNTLDANQQCSLMLHELMHWAGAKGAADHDDANGAHTDEVYSCGRYCGHCSHYGAGSPNNSSVDCARCADSADGKQACGARQTTTTGDCAGQFTGICHQGLACLLGDCQSCNRRRTEACDGTLLSLTPTCCQTCPSNCNASNDFPCNGTPPNLDGCTDTSPPLCP